MENKAVETVDKTIKAMGEWIQMRFKQDERHMLGNWGEVAEMAKALAELVSAREKAS